MRPRVSILNLLLVTTVVALVIVVIRVRAELQKERTLRIQLLQKGGVLQVADPESDRGSPRRSETPGGAGG